MQLGDGAALAREIGIPVVYDFRAADVAAGGQGAPLVPVFHRALARTLDRPHPIAVLNLGGVANITFIDGENDPIACDTGPANALIDDFMRARNGAARDEDGRAAAKGRVDDGGDRAAAGASVLCAACAEIARPQRFPRMGRGACRARGENHRGRRRDADDAHRRDASRASSTVLPRAPQSWIVAGGGARNPTLMRMLAERLAPARSRPRIRSAGRSMRSRRRPSRFSRCAR